MDSPTTPSRLRFDAMRDLYQAQRARRETIRNSVATPVSALAFSVFNLSNLATNYSFASIGQPIGLAIAVLGVLSVLCLFLSALLIIRVEREVIYLDPPDLEELVRAEKEMRNGGADDDTTVRQMQELLAGGYDIVYRRYFTANEQASRDRTRGLHLILLSLALLSVGLLLLPLQPGGN